MEFRLQAESFALVTFRLKAELHAADNIVDIRGAAFIMASVFQTDSASTPGEVPNQHTSEAAYETLRRT